MSIPNAVIAAAIAGTVNIGYKWVHNNGSEEATQQFGRDFIKTAGLVIVLGVTSLIPLFTSVVSGIAWVYVGIIVLNTGTDILKSLGAI